jgi:adenylosuccinate lyase
MVSANERDKRAGVTEQAILPEVSCLVAGMLRGTLGILAGLHVYPERMQANLGLLDGLLLSVAVMLALARHIGRQRAHEVVYGLCMDAVETRRPLRRLLLEDPRVNPYLGPAELDGLLDPARYTGLAARFVDRVTSPSPASPM